MREEGANLSRRRSRIGPDLVICTAIDSGQRDESVVGQASVERLRKRVDVRSVIPRAPACMAWGEPFSLPGPGAQTRTITTQYKLVQS